MGLGVAGAVHGGVAWGPWVGDFGAPPPPLVSGYGTSDVPEDRKELCLWLCTGIPVNATWWPGWSRGQGGVGRGAEWRCVESLGGVGGGQAGVWMQCTGGGYWVLWGSLLSLPPAPFGSLGKDLEEGRQEDVWEGLGGGRGVGSWRGAWKRGCGGGGRGLQPGQQGCATWEGWVGLCAAGPELMSGTGGAELVVLSWRCGTGLVGGGAGSGVWELSRGCAA